MRSVMTSVARPLHSINEATAAAAAAAAAALSRDYRSCNE